MDRTDERSEVEGDLLRKQRDKYPQQRDDLLMEVDQRCWRGMGGSHDYPIVTFKVELPAPGEIFMVCVFFFSRNIGAKIGLARG